MNILNKFTRKCLAANKSRTIVTIIGIMLSMALFTAVLEGAYSGVEFLQRSAIERYGNWHGLYFGTSAEQIEEYEKNPSFAWVRSLGIVGWSDIGSSNEYKPYILVESINSDMKNTLPIKMLEGRMPENSLEILISDHLKTNGNVDLKLGDSITLNLGKRVSDGYELDPSLPYYMDEEAIVDSKTYTFEVVGICERITEEIEYYQCPGYTAYTCNIETCSSYITFINMKNIQDSYTELLDICENNREINSALIGYSGITQYSYVNILISNFAIILCVLISIGSISLIYNSFSISVSERIKMFGILKSIGATGKQIRYSVIYEAVLLSLIAIPLGLIVGVTGIGITLWCLRDSFASIIDSNIATQMSIAINPVILIIAILTCFITTIISAWIPSKKVARLSSIDAIRLTDTRKLHESDVKTSKFVLKVFGIEGLLAIKNFKRNRKKYRSVVASLAISIMLFVGALTFCSEIRRNLVVVTGESNNGPDISYTLDDNLDIKNIYEIQKFFESIEGIYNCVYFLEGGMDFLAENKYVNELLNQDLLPNDSTGEKSALYMDIVFINDEAFDSYCKKEKLDPKEFKNKDNPKAVVYNDTTSYYEDIEGNNYWYEGLYFDNSLIGNSIDMLFYKQFDDIVLYSVNEDINDNIDYIYCNVADGETIEKILRDNEDDTLSEIEILEANGIKLYHKCIDEITETHPIEIGALTDQPIFPCSYHAMTAIYPFSMAKSVLGEYYDSLAYQVNFAMKAKNPKKTFELVKTQVRANGMETENLYINFNGMNSKKMLSMVVTVFSFGFIILISLICLANVFNTISTNIMLRRREFAMLKSVGLSPKGFEKMMNFECLIFGIKSILWGAPLSFACVLFIFLASNGAIRRLFNSFYLVPMKGFLFMVVVIFVIVFSTMIYSTNRIKKNNLIDELRSENI